MKKSMIYRVLIYIAGLLILGNGNRPAIALYSQKYRFTKNCFDVLNVTITIWYASVVCTGRLHGIGNRTDVVILVGRTIEVFNHFRKEN